MDRRQATSSGGQAALDNGPPRRQNPPSSSNVLWLKLNFTVKAARLQTLKRQKYQHLQAEALFKAQGVLQNWADGPEALMNALYRRASDQGDVQELLNYTPEALALRFSLRNDPDVEAAVKQLWAVELPRDALGCIDQRGYAAFFRRVGRSLEPEATVRRRRRMEETIREDWVRDSKDEAVMGFASFFDSVFELADLWCDTTDVAEYVAFLGRLLSRITTARRSTAGRRVLRPLKQVKAMESDDASSSSSDGGSRLGDGEEEGEGPMEDCPDGDDDDASRQPPVQVPNAVAAVQSGGFVAHEALQRSRSKTPPPSSASRSQEADKAMQQELDPLLPSYSSKRRASIITIGGFGDNAFMGLTGENDASSKTPTGFRSSSAKSRTHSAKRETALKPVTETGDAAVDKEKDDTVSAILALYRNQAVRPRTPVAVVESSALGPGPNTLATPTTKLELNMDLPAATSLKNQTRPGKLFMASFGVPDSGGNLPLDRDTSSSSSSRGRLAGSRSQLISTSGGLGEGLLGGFRTAQVGSGAAQRSALMAASSRSRDKAYKKHVLDGDRQLGGGNKRLAALGVASGGPRSSSTLAQATSSASRGPTANGNGCGFNVQQLLLDGGQLKTYVSGAGLDGPMATAGGIGPSRLHYKPTPTAAASSLPVHAFQKGVASPAKRLLPPVLDDSRSGSDDGSDFSRSYQAAAYLSGTSQGPVQDQSRGQTTDNGSSIADSSLKNQQDAIPHWVSVATQQRRVATKRSSRKQRPPRVMSPDDRYSDLTVSPWDTKFDDELDNDAFVRAVPRRNLPPQRSPSPSSAHGAPCTATGALLASVSSPELMALPHDYRELVVGEEESENTRQLHSRVQADLTESPQASSAAITPGSPQDRVAGGSPPALTLPDDGLEGHAVVAPPGSSTRRVLSPLQPKKLRRDVDHEDSRDHGLCLRFVEHCEVQGERAATAPSPLFHTEKPKRPKDSTKDLVQSDDDGEAERRHRHCSNNNNRQEDVDAEDGDLSEDVEEDGDTQAEDATMIVNVTRRLVLNPNAKEASMAKHASHSNLTTRSEMMRRRCQYNFAKHLY
ncbi:hypothetical protein BBJ28_00015890 [Nothophytophthora sp. Chile5]|nr:hypothetical protein BBJ28_00015890 [Nothophytophthora sp. Chile5]